MTISLMTPMDALQQQAAAWSSFLAAAVLLLIRISGMMVFALPFSSSAIPMRIKAGLTVALAVVLTPLAASTGQAISLGVEPVVGELSVGLLLGLCISMMHEAMTFAGQLLNLEFSFSLVNVLDPGSTIETPLMSQLLSLIFLLVVFTGGLYRTILEAFFRTILAVPVGQARLDAAVAPAVATMFGGVLVAGLQLAAPIMAATFLVDVVVALAGKLSPQLPVLVIGIPLKTMTGYLVLMITLTLWPRFIGHGLSTFLGAGLRLLQHRAGT